MADIDPAHDIIDVREVIERVEELRDALAESMDSGAPDPGLNAVQVAELEGHADYLAGVDVPA